MAFWAAMVPAALVVALVVYPLSFGPVVWLYAKLGRPHWLGHLIDSAPDPVEWIINHSPESVAAWISQKYYAYFQWWIDIT
jgi:hypothetical protein